MDAISQKLLSAHLEEQAQAFDEISSKLEEWSALAIQLLIHSPDRFLIAERLARLGPVCIAPLKEVLRTELEREVLVLASLVLFQLGDLTGVPILLEVLRQNELGSCLAAGMLAARNRQEAGPALLEGLQKLEVKRFDEIVAYVQALRTLQIHLPEEVIFKLTQPDVAWQVRSLFDPSV